MTVLATWTARLATRRALLKAAEAQAAYWRKMKAKAKKGTAAHSHAGALLADREAKVKARRSQVAYAERVVKRHASASDLSAAGLSMLVGFEGERLTAYHLAGEQFYTIGVGHYGADVKPGEHITHAQALALLHRDCGTAIAAVRALGLSLTQGQFDALVSIAFNCGTGVLAAGSTLGAALRRHDMHGAREAFALYVHGANGATLPGLVSRRKVEAARFGA